MQSLLASPLGVMNAGGVPYKISNAVGDGYSTDFETNVKGAVEHFDVYGEVQTRYSQAWQPALIIATTRATSRSFPSPFSVHRARPCTMANPAFEKGPLMYLFVT